MKRSFMRGERQSEEGGRRGAEGQRGAGYLKQGKREGCAGVAAEQGPDAPQQNKRRAVTSTHNPARPSTSLLPTRHAGVTAINLEALQIMRRGAPPSGANPFPVALPLNASTAASGLQAAAAAAAGVGGVGLLEQQQQQVDAAVTAPGEGSVMLSAPGTAAGTPPHNTWAQQPGGVLYSQIGDAAAAQSVYGAAAVVQLQPQARPQQQGVGSPMSGPRVYVERGPASKGSPIATSSPAHLKGSPQQQAQQGQQRSVGVRRALHHSQPGK